uniref:Uncharacterized protein n=1 Tax=Leersia perrieri TaxID=77586 RepID=A0A0D9XKK5_9ORYZ
MEVASLSRTPQPHHLAELRIEGAGADQSQVAFSDSCAVGRKRRCLFPAFSPRKRMLLELPPFSSSSSSADPEGVFSPAKTGGGAAFAFFAASPRQLLTPMGSTATGTGSNGDGGFAFLASPTPPVGMIPNAGGGFAFFRSPEPERNAGETTRSGFPFLAPPKPVLAPAVSPSPSPASAAAKELVSGDGGLISGQKPSASSPVKKLPGRSLWSRRLRLSHAAAATTEGRTIPHPPSDEQLHITLPSPPQKFPKTTVSPATGDEPSRGGSYGGATLPASMTATPCCTFLTSLAAKAKGSSHNQSLGAGVASVQGGWRQRHRHAAATGGEVMVLMHFDRKEFQDGVLVL